MTNEFAPDLLAAAEVLWDYHDMHHPAVNTDVGIGLGSHDIGVADHTVALYNAGRFPLIVFTGANAPTTREIFPRGEAIHYTERAIELGVARDRILTESRATNTGANIEFTRDLLAERSVKASSVTLISRPYQQRRAYATCRKRWPEVEPWCSSQRMSLDTYIAQIGDADRVFNMLVGDTQRIQLYAEKGFAIPQPMPGEVDVAMRTLVDEGFDKRLI